MLHLSVRRSKNESEGAAMLRITIDRDLENKQIVVEAHEYDYHAREIIPMGVGEDFFKQMFEHTIYDLFRFWDARVVALLAKEAL